MQTQDNWIRIEVQQIVTAYREQHLSYDVY